MNISTENSNKTKRFAFIVHGAAGAGRARAVWKRASICGVSMYYDHNYRETLI
jgi:hypothetical protein